MGTTIPRESLEEKSWQEIMLKTHVKAIHFIGKDDTIFYKGELT